MSMSPKKNDTETWFERRLMFYVSVKLDEEQTESNIYQPKALVFLGSSESFFLYQILLRQTAFGIKTVYTIDSKPDQPFSLSMNVSPMQNDTFMRRYMMINKAKNFKVFGLIVISAWSQPNMPAQIASLSQLLRAKKKKPYVFTMSTF